ncbi:MAG: 2-amino-4-hydroxy-6-hydroxymethyldihydropteridine diphosphokinase [Psychromonas sp.]
MISYIGIGSNQSDPIKQAKLAIETLHALPQTVLNKCSSLYSSTPMGPQDQPDYVNAVAEIDTQLTALQLLDELQKIELSQGRVRKENRWGPRTLDLDIILYGKEVINNTRLTIPHYGMKVREFVIYPLLEITTDLRLPDGESLIQLSQHCDKNGLTIISA